MPNRKLRALAAITVAATLAVVALLDDRRNERRGETVVEQSTTSRVQPETTGSAAPALGPALPSIASVEPPVTADASGVPVRLTVQAPALAAVGETFESRVHVEAPGGVRRLAFAVHYDRKRLKLLEASEGDFARRAPTAALSTDEPSEGNIQVSLVARDDRWVAGAGSAIVLRFEAIAPGMAAVAARDFVAFDGGARRAPVAAQHDSTIAIR